MKLYYGKFDCPTTRVFPLHVRHVCYKDDVPKDASMFFPCPNAPDTFGTLVGQGALGVNLARVRCMLGARFWPNFPCFLLQPLAASCCAETQQSQT